MCRPVTILDTQENTQYHFWYNGIIFLSKKNYYKTIKYNTSYLTKTAEKVI